MPAFLSDAAKLEWERVGPQLEAVGLVSHLDRAALAAYCVSWARWVQAEEGLKEFGLVVKTPSGHLQQSLHLSIANKALEQMLKAGLEFGMTPSSRSRVRRTENPAEKKDALSAFLQHEEG